MHILHVLDHSIPLQSGYTFRSRAILSAQRERGWSTCHVTGPKHNPGKEAEDFEEVDGLRFYRCGGVAGFMGRLPVLNQLHVIHALTRRIIEVAKLEKPDIIHAHSPALNGAAAVRAGKKLGIPVVYEVRAFWEDAAVSHGTSSEGGLRYLLTRGLETRVLKAADGVVCICDGLRGDIEARGIAASKITVVPNAVDAGRFQPVGEPDAQLASSLGLEGKKVVAFIGSFYAYEGLDLLVAALPGLLQADPTIRLLLVGGGQVTEELKTQVAALHLQDKVIMTGRVPHNDVEKYYGLADILAYPRKSMRLTDLVTPLKPLEAMAQKSLFVASDVGGHRELVKDGETGILFQADDSSALASALIELFSTRDKWPQIVEAGRHFVECERTWTNSVANIQPVYERLAQTGDA